MKVQDLLFICRGYELLKFEAEGIKKCSILFVFASVICDMTDRLGFILLGYMRIVEDTEILY